MIEYARLCEWFAKAWEERERQERCRRRVAEVLACLEKRKRLEILRKENARDESEDGSRPREVFFFVFFFIFIFFVTTQRRLLRRFYTLLLLLLLLLL